MILSMAMERLISAIIPYGGLDFETEIQHFISSFKLPLKPVEQKKVNSALEMVLERLGINLRIREKRS